jgi:hypothetical protein
MRRFLNKLLRDIRTTSTAGTARRAPRRSALQVECLESRLVLSTNPTSLLPGFVTKELNALQTSINQQLFNKSLPLVGTALNQVGNSIVGTFEKALLDGAQAAISGNMQAVKTAIIQDLDQGSSKILPGSILQAITATTDGKGGFTAEVHLHDSSVLNTPKVDLNLGLPGLPIQFAAHNLGVNVQAGYDIVLDFGMQGGSPFLKSKADPSNKANPLGVALNVSASVAPGSSISATLGGLTATLTQPTTLPVSPVNALVARQSLIGIIPPVVSAPPSTFNATLDFGFSVSTNGGIQIATPQLSGAANINLQASLSLDNNPSLPSITAGLNVNWTFNSADPTSGGLLGNAPTVSFNNVTVDLGSFLSNVVGPVVSAVQQFTKPLETVAEVLTSNLPGITAVTNFLHMQPIKVANLLPGGSALLTFANTIEFINGLQIPASRSIKVNVGNFNITDARQANSSATNVNENSTVKQIGLLGATGDAQTQSSYSNLQFQADFDFPMLDNPLGFVSSVLLGQQVALVKANLGVDFNAGINVNIPFFGVPGVGSLNVNFKGGVNLDAGATFVLTDGFLVGGSLLNSLQVQNAHVDLDLNVGAGVSATVLGVGVALDATVGVTFDVGLTNKTTGSTTFTGSDLLNGNVSLNVTTAQLQAGAELDGVSPFGSVTLVSFPLLTENLLTGASTQSGGGGAGGGGGNGPTGSGGHHQLQ